MEKKIDDLKYEEAFAELEKIVGELEGDIANLDKALQLFERGQALAKHCAALLEKAELKVQELTDGGELRDFE
jgi:exodeoxyribonuclease VII small subunit